MKTDSMTTTRELTNTDEITKWVVDPAHSEFLFKVKHMMISTVTGRFERFDATVETSGEDFTDAEINVEVDVNSITTNSPDRDKHLKSDDFFNAEKYPVIRFRSVSFDGENLEGDLTIREVTRRITLKVVSNGTVLDPYGQTKAGFELTGEINRKAFGLKWDAVTEAGNVVVSETVKLAIGIQFISQG